jgi:hypothetical protein
MYNRDAVADLDSPGPFVFAGCATVALVSGANSDMKRVVRIEKDSFIILIPDTGDSRP